ncbi:MAG: hypothetical protein ACK4E3_04550 [Brevundimonas sp.]|uniref:hypothetical protein n=1 Tax=Brevundimonas sp. TaxID=1871086 RepID=UPI00391C5104
MTDASPVTAWRKRRQKQGFVRVEVQVRKDDVPLVREVASALGDPVRETQVRNLLREKIGGVHNRGLKDLLAAAPFDRIVLDRPHDAGREISL